MPLARGPRGAAPPPVPDALLAEDSTLTGALDRLLNTGVVLQGELVLAVADIDLLYVGLNLLLASVETVRLAGAGRASDAAGD